MVDCWTALSGVLPAAAAADEVAGAATLVAAVVATVRRVVGLPPQAGSGVSMDYIP